MSEYNFNANTAPEPMDFEPMPVGDYLCAITNTEIGEPNDKGTKQLLITFKVLNGDHKGREVREWYTIICPTSAKAEEIAQRNLRQICESIGIAGFTQTEELHDKPLIAVLNLKDPNEAGNVFNGIKYVKPYRQSTPPPQQAPNKEIPQSMVDAANEAADANDALPGIPNPEKKPWDK